MAVITNSRQYGSGGKAIAKRVCGILGYSYFDKNLMVQVASEMGGFSEDQIVDFSEDTYKMRGFVERLFGSRRVKIETWDEDAKSPRVQSLDESEGVELVRDTILAAYDHGNVVIVGRGGQAILREQPGVLHVRINAPRGARVLRIKEREGFTMAEASDLATRKDLAAAAYLGQFFDEDLENPMLYHLILNAGRLDLDATANIIVNALSQLRTVSRGLV
jgi:cytidylate kinase